jgi:hypothetical protein
MADFCKQCSIFDFGEDFEDLKGLLTPEQVKTGLVVRVICEGCGPTYVNNDGECVYHGCIHKHGVKVK